MTPPDVPNTPEIVFALDRYHPDFATLAEALQPLGRISILARDDAWETMCKKHGWRFFSLEPANKSPLNRRRWGLFRLLAGLREQRHNKRVAANWLKTLSPDLLILAKDHKDLFYFMATTAACPTFLPQLTLYSKEDLTVGYTIVTPAKNPLIRWWQRRIHTFVNGQLMVYRENIWYTLGKYLGGFRQAYISKGGNVDVFAVNGPAFKTMYSELGLPEAAIHVLGGIEHDALNALRREQRSITLTAKPTITFFLPPLFGGEPSQDAVTELRELLKHILERWDCIIQLKPHPLDVKKQAEEHIAGLCPDIRCTVLTTAGYATAQELAAIVSSSDLLVHSASSVLFTILALEKPSLVYVSRKSPYYNERYRPHYKQYATYADNADEFMAVFSQFIESTDEFKMQAAQKARAYTSAYMMLDGGVVERYTSCCCTLLNANSQ